MLSQQQGHFIHKISHNDLCFKVTFYWLKAIFGNISKTQISQCFTELLHYIYIKQHPLGTISSSWMSYIKMNFTQSPFSNIVTFPCSFIHEMKTVSWYEGWKNKWLLIIWKKQPITKYLEQISEKKGASRYKLWSV